jgi:Holliday junction resolvase RusA-like endonuclease
VAHEKAIREAASTAMVGRHPVHCPVGAETWFNFVGDPLEWPTSQADGDIDDLKKAIMDGLNKVAYIDDRLVVSTTAVKRCGPKDSIKILVRPCSE